MRATEQRHVLRNDVAYDKCADDGADIANEVTDIGNRNGGASAYSFVVAARTYTCTASQLAFPHTELQALNWSLVTGKLR